MKSTFPIISAAILYVSALCGSVGCQTARPTLIFNDVAIIDVANGVVKPRMTVVVAGNRITQVGKRIRVPSAARVVDGKGKFLIPGLWDMHAHSISDKRYEWAFPLFIANGVTGIREMGNNVAPETVNEMRREISDGKILGPRFGAATYRIIDGAGTQVSVAIAVTTPEQGRKIVRDYKRVGADFIKPYNLLSRETYLAISDEAKKIGIPVEGHVPFSMSASEVSDLGQLVIEHNFGVLLDVSANEKELRDQMQTGKVPWPHIELKASAAYDPEKAQRLFERFARNGTWSCPTVFFQEMNKLEGSNRLALVLRYAPKSQINTWQTAYDRMERNMLPEYREVRFQSIGKLVVGMQRAGVHILAGSDTGAFFSMPGFGLQDELEELVRVGLSPLEALRAATVNPAKFLKREKDFGSVEPGKLADLVLLDANPLKDISNTRRIDAVVANGRFLSRQDLDKLLSDVERMNVPK